MGALMCICVTNAAFAAALQTTADNRIVWQNFSNQKTAFWVLNSNGTLKNRTQGNGWDNIGTWTLSSGWVVMDKHLNGGRDNATQLIWQNTLNGKTAYWKLNSNGTLKNRTQGDGWDNISSTSMSSAWRISKVLYNADRQSNDYLQWFNTSNRKAAYWILNSNGSLKNRTQADGWGNTDPSGLATLANGWRLMTAQANADANGNEHLIWLNTLNGKSAYWKLNSNGTLKSRTQADGWNYISSVSQPTSWSIADLQYNADKRSNTHLIWQDSRTGKTAYWKLNSNGSLKNRTQADGWDNIGAWTLPTAWSVRGVLTNADNLSNDHLVWFNASNAKTAYWKLNSNGSLKNRTQGDGWDNIGTWQMPTTWRIRTFLQTVTLNVN